MKTIIYIITISLIHLTTLLVAQETSIQEIENKLHEQIEKIISETGVPSISFSLFNADSILLSQAYGFSNLKQHVRATPQSIYHTGSTFKTITATAIMQLCERGLMDLDVPINNYLKEDSIDNGLDCECPLTMRHLLSHHAGLMGNTDMIGLWDRKELKNLKSIAQEVKQIKEPGKEFEYCNHCYAISALELEHVVGVDFMSYVNDSILKPLKISENPFAPSPEMMAIPYKLENNKAVSENYIRFDVYPAGDAYLNPASMAKALMLQLNGGKYKGVSVLDKGSITEMQSRQFDDDNYGLGLFLNSLDAHNTISHGGTLPGFTSYFLVDLNTKNGVYLMSNAGEVRQVLEELSTYTVRLMNGNGNVALLPSFKKKEMIEISESILQSYVGKYEVAPGVIAGVTKEGGQLFVQISGQPRFDLFPYEETKFSLKVMDAQIEFVKDTDGQVNGLILVQGTNKVPGKRVDEK